MSTIRKIFAFLATCTLASGIAGSWNGVAVTAWNGIAQTAWNGTGVSQAAVGGGWNNLVSTDFEGAGLPAGWSVTSGTPNWDNTTNPQVGAQDLMMNASVETDIYYAFSAQTEIWIKFKLRYSASGTAFQFIYITTAGAQYVSLGLTSGGRLELFQSGSTVSSSTDALSTATSYFIWMHIKKGTGANAIYDAEFAATDSRVGSGNKFTSYTIGTHTQDITRVNPYHGAALGATWQCDDFQVGSTTYP